MSGVGAQSIARVDPPRSRGAAVAICLAIGYGWALLLMTAPLLPEPLLNVVLLGNGFAAAAYLTPLYWIRGSLRDEQAAVWLGAFAACHIVWLTLSGSVLAHLSLDYWGDGPLLMLITGAGFALALGLASRSLIPALAMVGAGVIAATASAAPLNELMSLTVGCAILHCALVSTTALETLHRTRVPPPDVCTGCGYSIVGLPPAAPCPECGREASP